MLGDVRGHPSRIRPKQDARWLESRALEHTPASGAIARNSWCTARAAHGEHVRRALPARASGAGGTDQRRRARDAGLSVMSVRRGQSSRRISPRVCVSRGVVNLEDQGVEL